MTQLQIAPTTQVDLPAILDMAGETFRAHQSRHPQAFPDIILLKLEEIHRDAVDLAGDTPTSFSAKQNDDLMGYVLLREKSGGGVIYDIGVLPEYRRDGIGLALLNKATEIAKARHWRVLSATVWAGNTASHTMFGKAGFETMRLLPLSLERSGLKPTKITYRKVLC